MGASPKRRHSLKIGSRSTLEKFLVLAEARGWFAHLKNTSLDRASLDNFDHFVPLSYPVTEASKAESRKPKTSGESDSGSDSGSDSESNSESDSECVSEFDSGSGVGPKSSMKHSSKFNLKSDSTESESESDKENEDLENSHFFLGRERIQSPEPKRAPPKSVPMTPMTPVFVKGIFTSPGSENATPGKGRRVPKTDRKAVGLADRRLFTSQRESEAYKLFAMFNEKIFGSKLPGDMSVTWNKRLLRTAGLTYNSRRGNARQSRIELSTKVVDSSEKLRQTLVHEMCHVATWLINGDREHHGRVFRYWGQKCTAAFSDLVVTTCHNYDIFYKYRYTCQNCAKEYGRHSNSIDTTTARCGYCKGLLVLSMFKPDGTPCQKRAATPFALYVKENYAQVKGQTPKTPHREVMTKLSAQFKAAQLHN